MTLQPKPVPSSRCSPAGFPGALASIHVPSGPSRPGRPHSPVWAAPPLALWRRSTHAASTFSSAVSSTWMRAAPPPSWCPLSRPGLGLPSQVPKQRRCPTLTLTRRWKPHSPPLPTRVCAESARPLRKRGRTGKRPRTHLRRRRRGSWFPAVSTLASWLLASGHLSRAVSLMRAPLGAVRGPSPRSWGLSHPPPSSPSLRAPPTGGVHPHAGFGRASGSCGSHAAARSQPDFGVSSPGPAFSDKLSPGTPVGLSALPL